MADIVRDGDLLPLRNETDNSADAKDHSVSIADESRFHWSGGCHIKEINRLVGGEH